MEVDVRQGRAGGAGRRRCTRRWAARPKAFSVALGRTCQARRRQAAADSQRHAHHAQGRRGRRRRRRPQAQGAVDRADGRRLHADLRLGDDRCRAAAVRVHRPGLPAADRGGLGSQCAMRSRRARKQAEAEALVDLQQALAASAAGHDADPQRARVRQRERDARPRRATCWCDDGRIIVDRPLPAARSARPTTSSTAATACCCPGCSTCTRTSARGTAACTWRPASPPCATWATTTTRCSS